MAKFTRIFRCSLAATVLGVLPSSLVLTLPSDAVAESLNAKLGAWEITSTSTSSGTLIPLDVLATMPPERRAQIEASMKARSGKPQSFTTKECLTKEDLDLNRIIKEGEEEEEEGLQCTTKVIARSAGKLVMERACPAPRPSTSHSTFEAKTPESLTGTIDITRPGSGKVHVDIKGRWIGASCAGIED